MRLLLFHPAKKLETVNTASAKVSSAYHSSSTRWPSEILTSFVFMYGTAWWLFLACSQFFVKSQPGCSYKKKRVWYIANGFVCWLRWEFLFMNLFKNITFARACCCWSIYVTAWLFPVVNPRIVKSHFKALGLNNFKRGFGWAYKRGGGGGGLISGWTYKRNKKYVWERRDKTYLRNELKLTFHYILSQSVTFIIHLLCVTKQLVCL